MGAKIYITIEDQKSLDDILQEGKRKGLLKGLAIDRVQDTMKRKEFPIQIPVELGNIMDLMGNPIVKKMVGSKFDKAVGTCLQKIMEAG